MMRRVSRAVFLSFPLLIGCGQETELREPGSLSAGASAYEQVSRSDDGVSLAGYDDMLGSVAPPVMRRTPPVEGRSEPRLLAIRPLPPVADATPLLKPLPPVSSESQVASHPSLRRLPAVTEATESDAAIAARWSEAIGALGSVEEQARTAIRHGYDLAQKGALYSARAEFLEALRAIAGSLDAHYGGDRHTDALLSGLQALKEADDFAVVGGRLEGAVNVAATVAVHRSKVVSKDEARHLSHVLAMQRYYTFAQPKFTVATGGATVGAEALYGLGKVHMAFGSASNRAKRMHGPKAIAFLSAALTVDPRHAMAANELGVLYARLGKWQEARHALQQSVAVQPVPGVWQNLAVVHEQLGETQLALQARQQIALAAAGSPPLEETGPVRWVSPETFAASGGPATASPVPADPPMPATPRTAQRTESKFRWPW